MYQMIFDSNQAVTLSEFLASEIIHHHGDKKPIKVKELIDLARYRFPDVGDVRIREEIRNLRLHDLKIGPWICSSSQGFSYADTPDELKDYLQRETHRAFAILKKVHLQKKRAWPLINGQALIDGFFQEYQEFLESDDSGDEEEI